MIDEIYDLFIWDMDLSYEENMARRNLGLELAGQVRYLPPFLQPILPRATKSHWEPCAQVLASRSDDELELYLYPLLEWLQDMNWPGADTIYERLLRFSYPRLEPRLDFMIKMARKQGDNDWLEILKLLREQAGK